MLTAALVVGCGDSVSTSPVRAPVAASFVQGGGKAATVIVSPSSASIPVGTQLQLAALVTNLNGVGQPSREVTWTTSNAAVATVDTTGLVTGTGVGTASISASTSGKNSVTGAATVTVMRPPFVWQADFVVGSPEGVQGLDGTSDDDVWATCGYRCVFHYDGSAWSRSSIDAGANVYRPFSRGAAEVYFAGQASYMSGDVLRYDGTPISQLLTYGEELFGVWAYATDSGFACGEGVMLWFRPGEPIQKITAGLSETYQSPDRFETGWGTSATNMYCAGASGLYRFDGASMSQVVATPNLLHVRGTSASDVWVVGRNGALQHFNGVTWGAVDAGQGSADLLGVAPVAADEVFATDANHVYEYDGIAWRSWSIPAEYRVNAFALYAPSSRTLFVGATRISDNASFVLKGTR
jgi:Bacterial Ig-like domain (group 2)